MSLTIRDLFNDGMALLGIYNPDYSPQIARDHVLTDITAALQLMQMAGEEFYCREEYSLSLQSGAASYALDSDIQKVLEPARLESSGATLINLRSRSQFDSFGPAYMGQESTQNGTPIAYYVDALKSMDDNSSNSSSITIRVTPTPSQADTLNLYVVRNAPSYTIADLADPPEPPTPHKYHESILLPLVRMNVTTCDLFARNAQRLPSIQADYSRALSLLGLADPRKASNDAVSPELKSSNQRQQ